MSPVEGHQKNRELGHVTNKETLRALVFFSLKNRRLQDDLTVILSYPVGGNREDGARLFLEVHSKNDKRQLIKLQHGKFQVDIRGGGGRELFFTVRVDNLLWQRLTKSLPSVMISKTQLDKLQAELQLSKLKGGVTSFQLQWCAGSQPYSCLWS